MNKNGLAISLSLAAALLLSGCAGGAAGKADGNTNTTTAAAPSGDNAAAGATPAADGDANVATTSGTDAAPIPPTTGDGGAAQPGVALTKGDPRVAGDAQRADMPRPQVGSGGNDFYLFTQARGALNADAELRAANIIVDVKEGVLTLSGAVASAAQKSKAEQLAESVGGVKVVRNQLKISAGN